MYLSKRMRPHELNGIHCVFSSCIGLKVFFFYCRMSVAAFPTVVFLKIKEIFLEKICNCNLLAFSLNCAKSIGRRSCKISFCKNYVCLLLFAGKNSCCIFLFDNLYKHFRLLLWWNVTRHLDLKSACRMTSVRHFWWCVNVRKGFSRTLLWIHVRATKRFSQI